MKFKVGELRQTIAGLKNDREIEIINGKLVILPKVKLEKRKPQSNRIVDREKCFQLFRQGKTLSEIARDFGVSRQAIFLIINDLDKGGHVG